MDRLLVLILLFAASPLAVCAQDVWVGAALGAKWRTFPEESVPNRLDGAAFAWSASGGVFLGSHFLVAGEWARARPIDNVQTLSLRHQRTGCRDYLDVSPAGAIDVTARPATSHHVGQRLRLMYLTGVAWTHVRREFQLECSVAGARRAVPADPQLPIELVDRSPALTGAVDVIVNVTLRVGVVGGVRFHRLTLEPDQTGLDVGPPRGCDGSSEGRTDRGGRAGGGDPGASCPCCRRAQRGEVWIDVLVVV